MIQNSTVLADLYAPVRDALERASKVMDGELLGSVDAVNSLCTHVKRYRGKQIRPALLLLSGSASGRLDHSHEVLAAVVELVHLATLLHDDVLDEAQVRRRSETINALKGNETAVLLGDYFISHAYHLCSSLADPHAARAIGATTNTVCEGELLQVLRRNDSLLTEAEYFDIIEKKTASLTATCCSLGGHYAGADGSSVRALGEFGRLSGIAFQIVDDVLDLLGDEEETGKSLGRDLDLGKTTLPIIHALSHADAADTRRLGAAISGPRCINRTEIREILQKNGCIEHTLSVARDTVQRALSELQHLPHSPARESLSAMAEFILRRRF